MALVQVALHGSMLPERWTDRHTGVMHERDKGAGVMRLWYQGEHPRSRREVQVDVAQWDKLRDAYRRAMRRQREAAAPDQDALTPQQLNTRVYDVLLRYETLAQFDQGTQGTLPAPAFECLRDDWGVGHECFASPLNVTLGSFNSLFPGVDGCFGSLGSFYDWFPDGGAFEANPPFDSDSVAACFQHVNAVMRRAAEAAAAAVPAAARPLLFVIVTPFAPAGVVDPQFELGTLVLQPMQHGFKLGFQHRGGIKSRELWKNPRKTVVTFVGNEAAAAEWPVTEERKGRLRTAFGDVFKDDFGRR
jgi:phosphorylated CTD-interacting factor 1